MSEILPTLSEQIAKLVTETEAKGEYVTVRSAARTLNVKQTEIRDAIPADMHLEAASDNTLSQSQIKPGAPVRGTVVATPDENRGVPATDADSSEAQASAPQNVTADGSEPVGVVKGKAKREPKPKAEPQLDAEGNPIPEVPREICLVCGNPLRSASETIRGLCPLCFRELVRNSGLTAPKVMALTDEEFLVLVGKETGNRGSLEDYKNSRVLTPEQFETMKEDLIPVKVVFAAGKEKGYGPGRIAQAVGGDRFRHEPRGGFGSVWTPYFVGPRKMWYFDKTILDVLDELKKEPKTKKTKATAEGGDGETVEGNVTRLGARGGKMKPVEDDETNEVPTIPMEPTIPTV